MCTQYNLFDLHLTLGIETGLYILGRMTDNKFRQGEICYKLVFVSWQLSIEHLIIWL